MQAESLRMLVFEKERLEKEYNALNDGVGQECFAVLRKLVALEDRIRASSPRQPTTGKSA